MSNYFDKLNTFLADQVTLYMKLHNLHWYIKGSSFFTLHAEFEKLYDVTADVMDEVAERLLMLGQSPHASLKDVIAATTIGERDPLPVDAKTSVEITLADLEKLQKDAKEIVSLAAAAGDEGTADQFTGYLRNYEKTIWMLRSYLA